MSPYVENWEGAGFVAMMDDFDVPPAEREPIAAALETLHAYYCTEDYEGHAFVIMRSRADGSLWEVNGSHCSCNGLEGQWDMEPTTVEALIHRHRAQPLPGLAAGSGALWLMAMMEARELALVAEPLAEARAKARSI